MKNILITRQPSDAIEFINILSYKKFHPFLLPMIHTISVNTEVKKSFYDYIIFTSKNSVNYFKNHFSQITFKDIIAIGPGTLNTLEKMGYTTQFIPKDYSADGIIALLSDLELINKKCLLPGPKKREPKIENFLETKGASVDIMVIYETKMTNYDKNYIYNFLEEYSIEVITFFSPSAVDSFFTQFETDLDNFYVISMGKTTYNHLKSKGIKSFFPKKATVRSIIELLNCLSHNNE